MAVTTTHLKEKELNFFYHFFYWGDYFCGFLFFVVFFFSHLTSKLSGKGVYFKKEKNCYLSPYMANSFFHCKLQLTREANPFLTSLPTLQVYPFPSNFHSRPISVVGSIISYYWWSYDILLYDVTVSGIMSCYKSCMTTCYTTPDCWCIMLTVSCFLLKLVQLSIWWSSVWIPGFGLFLICIL